MRGTVTSAFWLHGSLFHSQVTLVIKTRRLVVVFSSMKYYTVFFADTFAPIIIPVCLERHKIKVKGL